MAVPILKQRHHLIASIQSALSDQDLLGLRDDLARLVGQHRALGVIIDVTALDVLDSFATRTLRAIAYMTKLRGAETVIVGIQPDVATGDGPTGIDARGRADRPRSRGGPRAPRSAARGDDMAASRESAVHVRIQNSADIVAARQTGPRAGVAGRVFA